MSGRRPQARTFAEIAAEARAVPPPAPDVRPGRFNAVGELFTPDGVHVVRTGEVTPVEARSLVMAGALLAFEDCGCGGRAGGCAPRWVSGAVASVAAQAGVPSFVKGQGAPTWLDLWESEGTLVVFAHGDVVWGDAWH